MAVFSPFLDNLVYLLTENVCYDISFIWVNYTCSFILGVNLFVLQPGLLICLTRFQTLPIWDSVFRVVQYSRIYVLLAFFIFVCKGFLLFVFDYI